MTSFILLSDGSVYQCDYNLKSCAVELSQTSYTEADIQQMKDQQLRAEQEKLKKRQQEEKKKLQKKKKTSNKSSSKKKSKKKSTKRISKKKKVKSNHISIRNRGLRAQDIRWMSVLRGPEQSGDASLTRYVHGCGHIMRILKTLGKCLC